jgi:hypothetical protein
MNALQRLMANGSVRFGASVLGLMLLVAAFAFPPPIGGSCK